MGGIISCCNKVEVKDENGEGKLPKLVAKALSAPPAAQLQEANLPKDRFTEADEESIRKTDFADAFQEGFLFLYKSLPPLNPEDKVEDIDAQYKSSYEENDAINPHYVLKMLETLE